MKITLHLVLKNGFSRDVEVQGFNEHRTFRYALYNPEVTWELLDNDLVPPTPPKHINFRWTGEVYRCGNQYIYEMSEE